MSARIALLLACGLAAAAHAEPEYEPPSSARMQAALVVTRDLDVTGRLDARTEPLLGAPYAESPLGEGDAGGPDADPRLRYDAFDCTTFIETAIALAWAEEASEIAPFADWIRYRGEPLDFENRRHFPAAEWIPQLVEIGVLEDLTRRLGGEDVVVETTILSPRIWSRRKERILEELPDERIPRGRFPLDVWPLEAARRGYPKIPSGTVLSTLRVDRPRLPVRVTHQGLVLVKDGRHVLRHAGSEPFERVVDEPLDDYLERIDGYRRWQVVGIHLARVRPPDSERTRRILAGER